MVSPKDVEIVVKRIDRSDTLPVWLPIVNKSPTLKGRKKIRSKPDAKLASDDLSAIPMAKLKAASRATIDAV